MTVTDQIEILDNKIKSNQAQYDLRREAAKRVGKHCHLKFL